MGEEEPFAFRDAPQNGLRILAKFEHRNRFQWNVKFKFKLIFWQTRIIPILIVTNFSV